MMNGKKIRNPYTSFQKSTPCECESIALKTSKLPTNVLNRKELFPHSTTLTSVTRLVLYLLQVITSNIQVYFKFMLDFMVPVGVLM